MGLMDNKEKPYLIAEILLIRKMPAWVVREITKLADEELKFLMEKCGINEELMT